MTTSGVPDLGEGLFEGGAVVVMAVERPAEWTKDLEVARVVGKWKRVGTRQ